MIKLTMQVLVPVLTLAFYVVSTRVGLQHLTEGVLLTAVVVMGTWSIAQYRKDGQYDGDLVVEEVNDFRANYSFELKGPAEELAEKDSVSFKVKFKS